MQPSPSAPAFSPLRPSSRICIAPVRLQLRAGIGLECAAMWMRTRGSMVCGAGVLLLASALAAQEHSYTQADIENGSRFYQSSCAGCHGSNSDMVPGVDLHRGRFRRGASDIEIV